jgi:hypothetical protein
MSAINKMCGITPPPPTNEDMRQKRLSMTKRILEDRRKPSVYVVELKRGVTRYLKFGITTEPSKRYSNEIHYWCRYLLMTDPLPYREAYALEGELLAKYFAYYVVPDPEMTAGGNSECCEYHESIIEEIRQMPAFRQVPERYRGWSGGGVECSSGSAHDLFESPQKFRGFL